MGSSLGKVSNIKVVWKFCFLGYLFIQNYEFPCDSILEPCANLVFHFVHRAGKGCTEIRGPLCHWRLYVSS